jgi:hypothetical protein
MEGACGEMRAEMGMEDCEMERREGARWREAVWDCLDIDWAREGGRRMDLRLDQEPTVAAVSPEGSCPDREPGRESVGVDRRARFWRWKDEGACVELTVVVFDTRRAACEQFLFE